MIDLKVHKKALEKRKSIFSYDMLGRSLSANPFFPRDIREYLKRQNDELRFIVDDINKIDKDSFAFLVFDDDIQNLSQIRRYLKIPLIREDYFYDEYQILEALVYGADCIMLKLDILDQKELVKLTNFAYHLGLSVIANIENKKDLTKAIFAKIDILSISSNNNNEIFKNLIPLIPNSKIILAKNSNDYENLIKLGVDSFFKV